MSTSLYTVQWFETHLLSFSNPFNLYIFKLVSFKNYLFWWYGHELAAVAPCHRKHSAPPPPSISGITSLSPPLSWAPQQLMSQSHSFVWLYTNPRSISCLLPGSFVTLNSKTASSLMPVKVCFPEIINSGNEEDCRNFVTCDACLQCS